MSKKDDEVTAAPVLHVRTHLRTLAESMAAFREEMLDLEERLVAYEIKGKDKVALRPLIVLLRTAGDRLTDRAGIMHDAARMLEAISRRSK